VQLCKTNVTLTVQSFAQSAPLPTKKKNMPAGVILHHDYRPAKCPQYQTQNSHSVQCISLGYGIDISIV
jgi:hypothetical protein